MPVAETVRVYDLFCSAADKPEYACPKVVTLAEAVNVALIVTVREDHVPSVLLFVVSFLGVVSDPTI